MAGIDIYPLECGVSDMEILNLVDIFKSQKTYSFEEDIKKERSKRKKKKGREGKRIKERRKKRK
jgi:hypothetical protein